MVKKKKSKDYTDVIIELSTIPMIIFCLSIGFWKGFFLMLLSLMACNLSEDDNNNKPYNKLSNIEKIAVTFFASFWIAIGLKVILIIIGLFMSVFSGGSTRTYEDCVKDYLFQGLNAGSILNICESYK